MSAALKAGAAYFAVVFLVGFALGTLRALVVAPRVGAVFAVLIEAPVILTASWFVCRGCVGYFRVRARALDRLAMGAAAFGLLMAAEMTLSVLAFGQSVSEHLATYLTLAGALGLSAQLGFAVMPLIQLKVRRASDR
jgi:hypothetical protein